MQIKCYTSCFEDMEKTHSRAILGFSVFLGTLAAPDPILYSTTVHLGIPLPTSPSLLALFVNSPNSLDNAQSDRCCSGLHTAQTFCIITSHDMPHYGTGTLPRG